MDNQETSLNSAYMRRVLGPVLLSLAASYPLVSIATPPITPVDFQYRIYSDTTAELFWLRTTNVAMRGYELTRNGVDLGVFDALSYMDHTLVPGIEYTYTITALALNGERSGTSALALRTPLHADTIATLQRQVSSLEVEIASLESLVNGGIRAPVPQTGQTIIMQSGDDGDFQAGVAWPVPRFTVNVNAADDLDIDNSCDDGETCNGTVTDNLTGLVWLQNANCFGARNWTSAIDDANGLSGDDTSGCGLSDNSQTGDWRLPNVKEMQSLIDYGHDFPTLLLPADHPFSDVQVGGINESPARYWTSTSTGTIANSGAYSVSLSVGWVERLGNSPDSPFLNYVFPVRDKP